MSQGIDRLWAPWRLEYVQNVANKQKSDRAEDCPFCAISSETPSSDNLILYRGERSFVIMNKFPYNPYHIMVLPNAHVGEVAELNPKDWLDMCACTQACIKLLKSTIAPQGMNLGMNIGEAAGAGIAPHLHMHILPRWSGDTNFMPLLAETKALPAHNLTVYKRLSKAFQGFSEEVKKFRMDIR